MGRSRGLKKKARDFTARQKVHAFAAEGREWNLAFQPKSQLSKRFQKLLVPKQCRGCLVSLCLGLACLTVSLNFLSSPPSYPHLLKWLSKPFSLLQFSPHINSWISAGIKMWTSYYQFKSLFHLFLFSTYSILSHLPIYQLFHKYFYMILDAAH